MAGQTKTLRQFIDDMGIAARQGWYDARNAYYQGKTKLKGLLRDSRSGAGAVDKFVREGQKGQNYLRDTAPAARDNIQEMLKDLDKKPQQKRK